MSKINMRCGNFVLKVVNGAGGLRRLRLSTVGDDWRVEWREDNPLFTTLPLICQNEDAFKVICLAFYSMTGWMAPADALSKALHVLTDALMQGGGEVAVDEDDGQAMTAAEMIEQMGDVNVNDGGDG